MKDSEISPKIKAEKQPTVIIVQSSIIISPVKAFINFRQQAPITGGIDKIMEYLKLSSLEYFKHLITDKHAPNRLIPGMKDSIWEIPTNRLSFLKTFFFHSGLRSQKYKIMANKIIALDKIVTELISIAKKNSSIPKITTTGTLDKRMVTKKYRFCVFLLIKKSFAPRNKPHIWDLKKTITAKREPMFRKISNSLP
jgi:hypothetical protein